MIRPILTNRPLRELLAELRLGLLQPAEILSVAEDRAAIADRAFLYRGFQEPGMLATPLAGLPVSVKDLFDVTGWPTTCGSVFFGRGRPLPASDAGYVARWRRAGASFVGKTNLNEFAYGITGENRWFGDCPIPGSPDSLTGGSSSGAAASIGSGAACVALGTDTGGSLRVPAALCGLVSFRQSHGFGETEGLFPLAPAFDTVGWMQRHLADVSLVATALHPGALMTPLKRPPRIACLGGTWLSEVDPSVVAALQQLAGRLQNAGADMTQVRAEGWEEALNIFVPVQASEAAGVHRRFLERHREEYDPAILARLELGLAIDDTERSRWERARADFVRQRVDPLWSVADFLLAPASALVRLARGADHTANRPKLLRVTTPASLAGLPALTVPLKPGEPTGIGFQFLARPGADAALWALGDWLADRWPSPEDAGLNLISRHQF